MNQTGQMNCPLSDVKMDQLMDVLDAPSGGSVIDVGCGSGVFLLRVLKRYDVFGMGIDIDVSALRAARQLAAELDLSRRVAFEACDITTANIADDIAICLGATHAFAMGESAYPEALAGMSRVVRQGGLLLFGEGYWKQPPAREYQDFLGDPTGVYRNHQENVALGETMGLTPLMAMTANQDEWDEFEWRHHRHVLAAAEKLSPKEGQEHRERAANWRNAYLKWGRETMGFGYYLFRRTGSA